jgi:hypothetical protein
MIRVIEDTFLGLIFLAGVFTVAGLITITLPYSLFLLVLPLCWVIGVMMRDDESV